MHKRLSSHLPQPSALAKADGHPSPQGTTAGLLEPLTVDKEAGMSDGGGWSPYARSGKSGRNFWRQLRGAAVMPKRASRGSWTGCHPDSFFWWFFLLGVTLWVLLVLLVQFKARDAYFVNGTSGADVAGTEVAVNLPVFETGSQLEGIEDDNDERYKFYNISDFNPVEVRLSENGQPLPMEDDDFQLPVETQDPSDSIFNLLPIGARGVHLSVVGPQGVHVTVQRADKSQNKSGSAPTVKNGISFGDLGHSLSVMGKQPHDVHSEAEQMTLKRVSRTEHDLQGGDLPESPSESAAALKIMDQDLPTATALTRGKDSPVAVAPGEIQERKQEAKPEESVASALAVPEESAGQSGEELTEATVPMNISHVEQSEESVGGSGQEPSNVTIAFNSTADFAWSVKLGQERPMPNRKITRVTDMALIYGRVPRWSPRSDISDKIKMVPKSEDAGTRTTEFREGCPAASQPLRLVPEFSNYIFKHYAAARAGSALRYVHMGTLAPMPYGGLVSAFQASHFTEGAEDQRIFLSFSKDGDIGQKWTEPIRLPVHARGAQWGPVLHVHPKTGNVWLFYTESSDKTCLRPGDSKYPPRFAPGGDIMATKTRDGKTWAAPHRIYSMAAEGGAPKVIANSVHVSRNGTWMLPFWRESHYFNLQTPCHTDTPASHGVLISRDDGRTWQPKGEIRMEHTHVYEGSVAELGDGSTIMVFRTQLGAAAMSRSTDDGETWSDPYLIAADNPDSKPNLVNIWPHGEVLMTYNDHTKENIACRNCRSKLAISRLVNITASWDHVAQFGPSPSDYLKVHYPTMIQHGCRLFVIYSSMYACCAPFGSHQCDCAPEGAEVGLLVVSFKIWEDRKTPEEQMANYTMRGKVRELASIRPWENHWWNDFQDTSIFDSLVRSKHQENLKAIKEGTMASFTDSASDEELTEHLKSAASSHQAGVSGGPRKVQFGLHSLEQVVAKLEEKEAQAAATTAAADRKSKTNQLRQLQLL